MPKKIRKKFLIPLGFRVLIYPDPVESKTESGIVLVENERMKRAAQEYGTIVAIGPSAWKNVDDGTPWAKVGDHVAYSRYGGKFVTLPEDPENKYVIIDDVDILCKIEES